VAPPASRTERLQRHPTGRHRRRALPRPLASHCRMSSPRPVSAGRSPNAAWTCSPTPNGVFGRACDWRRPTPPTCWRRRSTWRRAASSISTSCATSTRTKWCRPARHRRPICGASPTKAPADAGPRACQRRSSRKSSTSSNLSAT
jgi:hypothetical protein